MPLYPRSSPNEVARYVDALASGEQLKKLKSLVGVWNSMTLQDQIRAALKRWVRVAEQIEAIKIEKLGEPQIGSPFVEKLPDRGVHKNIARWPRLDRAQHLLDQGGVDRAEEPPPSARRMPSPPPSARSHPQMAMSLDVAAAQRLQQIGVSARLQYGISPRRSPSPGRGLPSPARSMSPGRSSSAQRDGESSTSMVLSRMERLVAELYADSDSLSDRGLPHARAISSPKLDRPTFEHSPRASSTSYATPRSQPRTPRAPSPPPSELDSPRRSPGASLASELLGRLEAVHGRSPAGKSPPWTKAWSPRASSPRASSPISRYGSS